MGLFLIGPSLFAQTDQDPNQNTESHNTEELEKVLVDYNKNRNEVEKATIKILETNDKSDLSKNDLDLSQVGNGKKSYSNSLKQALGPLQKLSEDELIKLLKNNTGGSSAAEYMNRFPRLVIFAVRLIKDQEAIPRLASIIDDHDRLVHFSAVMIITILLAFLLKRFMQQSGRSIGLAIGFWFVRFMIISSLRVSVLYYFYSSELAPTFRIAFNTFF